METYVKPNVIQKKEAEDSVFRLIALSASMRMVAGSYDEHVAQPLTARKSVA